VDAYEEVRRICARLPEVVEVESDIGARFKIRGRNVVEVFEWDGSPTMLVVWSDPDEREFLLAGGHPFFPLRQTDRRVGMVVDDATDWTEVAELVTESYRLTAPKKLVAQLEDG
jgi:hypothetical protein